MAGLAEKRVTVMCKEWAGLESTAIQAKMAGGAEVGVGIDDLEYGLASQGRWACGGNGGDAITRGLRGVLFRGPIRRSGTSCARFMFIYFIRGGI